MLDTLDMKKLIRRTWHDLVDQAIDFPGDVHSSDDELAHKIIAAAIETAISERAILKPVLQDWVCNLTFMQQSVLITACRGPDGLRNDQLKQRNQELQNMISNRSY